MNEQELLEKAIGIAVEAHRGQKDRYGAPYILHPLRVMQRVASPTEQIVAVLHDVVEDTDWTFEQLRREGFPSAVIEALERLTKKEGEKYQDFVRRSAEHPLSRRVKIADLEDNLDLRRSSEVKEQDLPRLQKYTEAWHLLQG